MICGGVRIVEFVGGAAKMNALKGLEGDISSCDEEGNYTLKVRGARDGKEIRVRACNIVELCELSEQVKYQEDIRAALLLEASARCDAKYLKERILAMELCDEFSYIVIRNTTGTFDPLSERAAAEALVRFVEAFYFGNGTVLVGGTSFTSFYKALNPFYEHKGAGQFEPFMGSVPLSSGELFIHLQRIFSNSVDELGERDEMVFFRAFSFVQNRMDKRSKSDTLLDAFCVSFYAIQLLQGKISSMLSVQVGSASSIGKLFRTFGRTDLKLDDLLWCFCILFLNTAIVVRDKVSEQQYNLIFPDPYGYTLTEQAIIVGLVTELRPNCPQSYLSAYVMVMDTTDLVKDNGESEQRKFIEVAYHYAVSGLKLADEVGNPFYQYIFHTFVAYWLPTSAHAPIPYSFGEMKSRLRRANEFKTACAAYVPAFLFFQGEQYEQASKQVFKAFKDIISDDAQQLTFPLMDSYAYSSIRFNTRYYRPGGKFDRLLVRYQCANCSKQVAQRHECVRCRKVTYCGRECQRIHWKASHKAECKPR